MSTLYNLEPQPTAKVLLNTTTGDLVLELFAKQAPLASRNFLQHCLDGYYDNTIFHRLVPGFIIQGGDPTGTGSGGVSAINNGIPFEDEFHSRLKFNRRGLLGMANSGEPNDNTSQFFLTLDKTPELQNKNTMFGRIEGDTIYNLMKMAEADLINDNEGADRPLYPTSIVSTEILLNPFGDMVKQTTVAARTTTEASKPVKKKRKAAKTLLSFGGDEGDEPVAPVVKKVKVNPNFVSNGQESTSTDTSAHKPIREKPTRKRSPSKSHSPAPQTQPTQKPQAPIPQPTTSPSPTPTPSPEPEKKQSLLEKTNAEIAQLKASMKRGNTATTHAPEKKLSALESMIPSTSTRGRKRGKPAEDKSALDIFNAFKSRLSKMPASTEHDSVAPDAQETISEEAGEKVNALDTEEKLCDLHFIANCKSCSSWHDDGVAEEEEEDDGGWMAHQLSFKKDTLGKDLEWKRKMEEFEVIDPREKGRELAVEKGKERKGRDWDRVGGKDKGKGKEKSRK